MKLKTDEDLRAMAKTDGRELVEIWKLLDELEALVEKPANPKHKRIQANVRKVRERIKNALQDTR